jgi:hypothetical protein
MGNRVLEERQDSGGGGGKKTILSGNFSPLSLSSYSLAFGEL